jgi:hypothetical protein
VNLTVKSPHHQEGHEKRPWGCGFASRRLRAVFSLDRVEPMPMPQRRRFKQTTSLHDRLAAWSKKILEQAANLPPGPQRNALLKKARQADTASAWKTGPNSPGFGRIMGDGYDAQ